ncbi:MAG: pyridoxamine 5'-phosphate oxidase [Phycisphaerales bacterium]|jgi:pyridoxamine 5'-phosphate oxidase|nr:pyridoxamine 5'-phosphate oxidase [Phycisphaerales bacterium]
MNFNSPPSDPVPAAEAWFADAERAYTKPNPLAASLATIDVQGRPANRMVLLKGFDARGAVMYTNYTSEKGQEIQANPAVSLLFHWDDMQRQLRIRGHAEKVSNEESDAYFATRGRLSQVGAWASHQSQPLKSRTVLVAKVAALTAKWVGRSIPRPEFWGGYRISLDEIEFWQGHDGRLHDRIRYLHRDVWSWQRLQP